jgi:2-polyprenyl-6-hydroxyphenyl methylase/3-demethylubiquinone-9 3-methyltransferase
VVNKEQHFKEHDKFWKNAPPLTQSLRMPNCSAFRKRLDWVLQHADGRVLDCGCNDGAFTLDLVKHGHEAVGVDILPVNINRALDNMPDIPEVTTKLDYYVADIENLPFEDKDFDTVVLTETLEHLIHPRRGLEEVHRVLKDDGIMLVSVPNGVDRQPTHYNTFDIAALQGIMEDLFKTEELESDFGTIYIVGSKIPGKHKQGVDLKSKRRA